ncbi:hypothetical protein, partial [Actinotignum timonense]|uniref:hypothetical protein n=1 Tax=Actinotignum timonense TaxID=1870995 RepID=UPI00254DD9AC
RKVVLHDRKSGVGCSSSTTLRSDMMTGNPHRHQLRKLKLSNAKEGKASKESIGKDARSAAQRAGSPK